MKSLSVSPHGVRVMVRGKRRSTKGTSIRYAIDRTASVLIYVQEKRHGRWITVRVIAIANARAGAHSLHYNAHQGKQVLPAGSCRVVAAARSSGGSSNVRRTPFSVFNKKVRVKHRPTRHLL